MGQEALVPGSTRAEDDTPGGHEKVGQETAADVCVPLNNTKPAQCPDMEMEDSSTLPLVPVASREVEAWMWLS